ncbi:unnamed protein product [Pleuronectes platessa]|uniref:Uncharacterized protein n=1 Tax=Pleuronectes platessa TaxID=8262 RepID=A0A9N7VGS1_PLEPL|nr:unnamed protein product [Pleuronectes platessa]
MLRIIILFKTKHGMTARPRPQRRRAKPELRVACGTVLAASAILPPPLTHLAVRSFAIGAGRQRRTEGGGRAEKDHRTVMDSAQTKWRRQKNRRIEGEIGRALACHTNTTPASGDTLALGRSAGP